MFSSPAAAGSVCLRCQLRRISAAAASRSSTPFVTASQTRIRRNGTNAGQAQRDLDALEKALRDQTHHEPSSSAKRSSWDQHASWDIPDEDPGGLEKETRSEQGHQEVPPRSRAPWDEDAGALDAPWAQQRQGDALSDRESTLDPVSDLNVPLDEAAGEGSQPADNRSQPPGSDALGHLGEAEQGFLSRPLGSPSPETRQRAGDRVVRGEDMWQGSKEDVAFRHLSGLKMYESRGNKLSVSSAGLTIDILGKPARAIVLKDRGQIRKRGIPLMPGEENANGEGEAEDTSSIEELVSDEQGQFGLEQAWENIERTHPEYNILSAEDFMKLHETLKNGFTTAQLASFLDKSYRQRLLEGEKEPELPEGVLAMPGQYPWITQQWVWTPEVPNATPDVSLPLKGYIVDGMKPKDRLAMKVIRECWGISSQELVEGFGHLDVRVRDLEFSLLLLGTQRWLQVISRAFLNRGKGKQIEMIRSQNLIRIVAPKTVAESILDEIHKVLLKVKSRSFSLAGLPGSLDDAVLREVGRTTNSIVEITESGKEIQVTWMDIRTSEKNEEDMCDIVFRLLLAARSPSNLSRALTIYPDWNGRMRFMREYGDKEKLSWKDRPENWARLVLPLKRTASAAASWPLDTAALRYKVELDPEDAILRKKVDREEIELGPKPQPPFKVLPPRSQQPEPEPEPTKPTPSGWMPYKVATEAVFGRVLHIQHVQDEASAPPPPASGLATAQSVAPSGQRILLPVIPPLNVISLPGWIPYARPIYATSTVLMRFLPAPLYEQPPGVSALDLEHAPHLELRLTSGDSFVIGIASLRAVKQRHVSDICLPANQVDVRAVQDLHAEIPGGRKFESAEGLAPLTAFLRQSTLEPGEGKLKTPARLQGMALPRWLLASASPAGSPPGGGRDPEVRPERDDSPESNALGSALNYVFAGLEVHRPVETAYDGWKLRYTSVEAGQSGGRRAQLSLVALPAHDRTLRREAEYVNASLFLRSVYKLARGLSRRRTADDDEEGDAQESIIWVDQQWKGH